MTHYIVVVDDDLDGPSKAYAYATAEAMLLDLGATTDGTERITIFTGEDASAEHEQADRNGSIFVALQKARAS